MCLASPSFIKCRCQSSYKLIQLYIRQNFRLHELEWRRRTEHKTTPSCWRYSNKEWVEMRKSEEKSNANVIRRPSVNSKHNSLHAYVHFRHHSSATQCISDKAAGLLWTVVDSMTCMFMYCILYMYRIHAFFKQQLSVLVWIHLKLCLMRIKI